MKLKFRFEYGQRFTRQQAKLLNEILDTPVLLNFPDEVSAIEPVSSDTFAIKEWAQEYVAEVAEVYEIMPRLTLHITGLPPAPVQMTRITEKLERVEELLSRFDPALITQQFNQKCEVHVPGLGLLAIEETKALVDYCSDALDDELQKGWRILAVCPQPDQRRPDYIVGRTRRD